MIILRCLVVVLTYVGLGLGDQPFQGGFLEFLDSLSNRAVET